MSIIKFAFLANLRKYQTLIPAKISHLKTYITKCRLIYFEITIHVAVCIFSLSVSVGMPKSMLGVYQDLQEKLSKAAAATEGMTSTSDLSIKKYRFRLQNAVTSTINSISANSGEDLRGKISRLRRLIRGEPIEVMGKPLLIKDQAAKMYCCNLLAKKLVVSMTD